MKNIFLILLALLSSFIYSQNCKSIFIGEVTDFHDKTPLENASIKLLGTSKVTISDNKGKFKFCSDLNLSKVNKESTETARTCASKLS